MGLAEWTTGMNLCSAVCILAGIGFIRKRNRKAHMRAMLAATGFSVMFLVLYLTRLYVEGTHRFPGGGWVRTFYLTLLGTHMVLAAFVPPLVIVTIYRALRGEYDRHRRIVRWTVPVWLYVSLTGPVIYVMLYHLY